MVFRYVDPVADASAYYEAQERAYEERRARLPRCTKCNKRIEDETFYFIEDEYICESCMGDYKVYTDDYLEN